jgi:predicted DsbA family dithiol-disulfide isomerase
VGRSRWEWRAGERALSTDVSHPIKVDIWSDIQCPWCYIGKRKFEAALAALADLDAEVEVEYHSFELAPDTPVDFAGSPLDYLSERKGIAPEQAQTMIDRVVGIAASVGLDYDYGAIHQTNTVLAHELLHLAKAHGRQAELKERLLAAYFVEGRHVGRVDDLADLAVEVGLDRAEAVAALTDHRYLADVKADVAQAAAYGINGVPFFVFDQKYGVSGAQETETFRQVLEQVRTESEQNVA